MKVNAAARLTAAKRTLPSWAKDMLAIVTKVDPSLGQALDRPVGHSVSITDDEFKKLKKAFDKYKPYDQTPGVWVIETLDDSSLGLILNEDAGDMCFFSDDD